jgi:tRNA A37 threonylcarbamoyladenosine dehydratase
MPLTETAAADALHGNPVQATRPDFSHSTECDILQLLLTSCRQSIHERRSRTTCMFSSDFPKTMTNQVCLKVRATDSPESRVAKTAGSAENAAVSEGPAGFAGLSPTVEPREAESPAESPACPPLCEGEAPAEPCDPPEA